ncbi:ABC transporter substrate-binding protein [Capilliphycus salinus ALCB114379]|uniref:ABC transporter substrate-binding protein n=1 Tax=Capilliphycus salinus TaxID=2768948 RepID=UPI0039A6EFE0
MLHLREKFNRFEAKRKQLIYRGFFILLTGFPLFTGCTTESEPPLISESTTETTALTIWWDKGFTLEEDEALQNLIQNWEKQTGKKVELSFYTTDQLPHKTQRAIQAGNPPDILMSNAAERVLNPKLAWEGQLVDVSDVIEPIQHLYFETSLKTVYLYNNLKQKHSYYGVPISQSNIYISYWQPLIEQAGYTEADIPKDWDKFWKFWRKVQDNLPDNNDEKVYAMAFALSSRAGDTYQLVEHILEAYDVEIINIQGQLQVERPEVRQGIINCLTWLTEQYKAGYVPPDTITWLNPDNNRYILNRMAIMTPNVTLSIPIAVRQDAEVYQNQLRTMEFPKKPSGEPMRYFISVKQAVIFEKSNKQEMAKEFLKYFVQPEVINEYLKTSGGRNLPVHKPLWDDPFWSNPSDPHLSKAVEILTESQTIPYSSVVNPAYSLVYQSNIWGQALDKILVEGQPPEKVTDEAIAEIKTIFESWE